MSIARDMRWYMLQIKTPERSASGAKKPVWKDVHEIKVAVYKNSELIRTDSERYKDSTHTGLTYCKDIAAGKYRLIKDEVIYQITSCDDKHRLTHLLLKVVETDV